MIKSGIDQQALIDQFSQASAKTAEQLQQAVYQATLGALQGRELSLKNIRSVLGAVTQAASTGAAQNVMPGVDADALLERAVAGMDDALLKAVEANRVALKQFVDKGVDLRETHLKKALADLEKFEDMLIGVVQKGAGAAGDPMAGAWGQVLDKLQIKGTLSGTQASEAAQQFMTQMQTAMRDSRSASLKAAQALAESYGALVSGVLIGMSDALQQGAGGGGAAEAPAAKASRKRGG